ncbi:MAG: tetratricopeptide repeat protein [Pseudomonadota bacterium]
MSNSPPLSLKIFVSSPGDVQEERVVAQQIIERLAKQYAGDVDLQAVFWEHEPLEAHQGFQENLPLPSETDLVVCILWSRIGTRLPKDFSAGPGQSPPTGTEFEIQDALRAYRAYKKPSLMIYRKAARQSILADDPQAEEKLRQHRALNSLLDSVFLDDDGALKAAHHKFDSSHTFGQILETHLKKWIIRLFPQARSRPTWTSGSPFRELLVFEEEHSPVFFGRSQAVADLLQKARGQAAAGKAFTLVLGQSGSGKSSLLRAGLSPLLCQPGVIEGVGLWRKAIFSPEDNGGRIFLTVADALLRALPELGADGTTAEKLSEMLAAGPESAPPLVKGGLSQAADRARREKNLESQPLARLLLVVDQFETVFTADGLDHAARAGFIATLRALACSGLVWVFAAMRSDFYHRLEEIPGLLPLKEGAEFQLALPTASELSEMVRRPAEAAGLTFEKNPDSGRGLDDVLIDGAVEHPENLPLLEFVLEKLYLAAQTPGEGKKTGLLELAAYKTEGGLEGAVANHAEKVLGEAAPSEAGMLKTVIRRLVNQRLGDLPTRRCAPKSEFKGPAAALVERLTKARILVAKPEGVVLAHDALLTKWPALEKQIRADVDFLIVRARLAEAESRWRQEHRRADLLLREGREVEEARDIFGKYADDFNELERDYIEASFRHLAAQKKKRRRRLQLTISVLCLLTLASLVGAGVAWRQSRLAGERRAAAEELVNFFTFDVREALENYAPLAIRERVTSRVDAYFRRWGSLTVSNASRDYAAHLNNQADIDLKNKNLTEAQKKYSQALKIFRELAALDPKNILWRRDVAVSLERIGDALAAGGDGPGALMHYQESLSIRHDLAALDPKNTLWRRDVTVSLDRIGDALAAGGDGPGALTHYQESLSIRRDLAALDPKNTLWRRDVTVSLNKVGDALAAGGDGPGALTHYQESLAIMRDLAALDPKNTGWRRDVAASLNNVGDALAAGGDGPGALTHYQEGLAIMRELSALDPKNTGWVADLVVSLYKNSQALKSGSDSDQVEAAGLLEEAFLRLYPLAQTGRLTAAQAGWPTLLSAEVSSLGDTSAAAAEASFLVQDNRASEAFENRNYTAALAGQERALGLLRRYQDEISGIQGLVAAYLSQTCWFASLAGDFSRALAAGQEATDMLSDDNACPARLNLAHALLFNNEFERARDIYQRHAGSSFGDGRKWKDEVRGDFQALRQAGFDHPDMKKIEASMQ